MDISTLSQQLNVSVGEVRDKIRELGFNITPRQRKIDNNIAKKVVDSFKTEDTEIVEEEDVKTLILSGQVVVKDLAAKMKVSPVEVIKKLIANGVMASMNEEIDLETAEIVASEFGYSVEVQASSKTVKSTGYVAEVLKEELEDEKQSKNFKTRPPIMAVMGHVDHGKTTLLDTLRKTSVAEGEAGAITQHIGAYQVDHNGQKITFLDTPGHEAFTQMRARGANVTDIIILVIAADDGIKPQTLEVINRAKLSDVPLIVAINKIDKPDANLERVKQEMSEHNLIVEEWGGKTIAVPISAKTGEGLDKLLEMALLLAEVEDYKANPKGKLVGTVVESNMQKGQGSVATVIVQNGTMKIGDIVVAGQAYARIRSLENEAGEKIKEVKPSEPALIMGLSDLPDAGDIFHEVATIDEARKQAKEYKEHLRARKFIHAGISTSGTDLNLILKADVQGSLEAIEQSLEELKSRTEEVNLNIIDKGIGEITETDVLRAESGRATIIGFSVKANPAAANLAKSKNVSIDIYNIIYELFEDVTKTLVSMLSPEVTRVVTARAKILAVFKTQKDEQIIGGRVEEGTIEKNAEFYVKRDGEKIGQGKIKELQRNKQEANEVSSGSEFGCKVKVDQKVEEDDTLEFYKEEIKAKTLE